MARKGRRDRSDVSWRDIIPDQRPPVAARLRVALILFLIPAIALAGCADPFAPRIDCKEYFAQHPGQGELVILVTLEPDGPPVEGAAITLTAWGTCWSRNERAVTDPEGMASWRFPAWGYATFDVVGTGLTLERAERVPLAADNASFTQAIALYKDRMSWEAEGIFSSTGPGILPVVGGDSDFVTHEVKWDASPQALEGYARRIVRLDVGLSWNNTQTSFADFAVGIGPSADRVAVFDSENDQSGAGSFEERASLGARGMYEAGWADATSLIVGPLSNGPHAALTGGLAYRVGLDAVFASPRDANVPLPVAFVLAAVLLAGMLARRPPGAASL